MAVCADWFKSSNLFCMNLFCSSNLSMLSNVFCFILASASCNCNLRKSYFLLNSASICSFVNVTDSDEDTEVPGVPAVTATLRGDDVVGVLEPEVACGMLVSTKLES